MTDVLTGATRPKLHAALHAVLDLTPPEMHEGDDPELHAILTDGWHACHTAVRGAIEAVLKPGAAERGGSA